MNIEIRQATKDDAKEIVRINIKSWKDTYKNIFPDEFLSSLDSKYEDTVDKCINKINEYIVATIDNKVVGFARFGKNKKGYSEDYSEIYALYVDNEFRNNNIGKKLLEYVFNILKSNYKYCLISTIIENRANSFYQKNGGTKIDESDFELLDNQYKENVYQFILN